MKTYFDPNTGECLYCHGTGTCPYCNGNGEILDTECSACDGWGECPVCEGDGKRELPELVEIPDHEWPSRRQKRTGRSSRHSNRREHHASADNDFYRWMRPRLFPNQRLAVDVLHPEIEHFRGHCIAAVSQCGFSQRQTQQLIKLIPKQVTYDQFIAVQGLANSHYRYSVIYDELMKIFYPWWKRILKSFLSQL